MSLHKASVSVEELKELVISAFLREKRPSRNKGPLPTGKQLFRLTGKMVTSFQRAYFGTLFFRGCFCGNSSTFASNFDERYSAQRGCLETCLRKKRPRRKDVESWVGANAVSTSFRRNKKYLLLNNAENLKSFSIITCSSS